ncbi:MAG TPA: hypothetical protein VGO78_00480 [Acidimicrobiales bacterium]|nr:hypothetical protein [Acidimicrobiales bacterium]
MNGQASAGTSRWRRDPPPWSENGAWLLWGLLSCGFFTAIGFLTIGLRYRRRSWLLCAGFYGACSAELLVALATVPVDESGDINGTGWQSTALPVLLLVWLAALIQSVVVQVRQPRHLPVAPGPPAGRWPWPATRATYARSGAWPPAVPGGYPAAGAIPPPGVPAPVAVPVATRSTPSPALPPRPDPPAWAEPWAGFVRSAERARDRFRRSAERVHPGPLHDALHDLAGRIDTSVDECRRIATTGRVLAEARAAIDTEALDAALGEAVAHRDADPDDPRDACTVTAIESQRATGVRMDEVIDDTLSQLRLLDARLGEAVVRMLELSAQAEVALAVPQLSSEVDNLVTDLEALRQAVEETHAVDVLGAAAAPPASSGWDQPA